MTRLTNVLVRRFLNKNCQKFLLIMPNEYFSD